ncbi:DNA-binding IclR family transcriptional regulator [Lipingzhangella halophila]|uniref:DNA-binding IclR family transcriptional regulator n=1 Tax=Lipingzhangella halophila TaxID=1783352 RepID=A0A7W7RPI9_9ACTN|nr:IclR family transcriptional regulator [Lipingzhangella halophila]MBB4935273.1 DNA-binding IclR family transcriptional regulator [Lipingzhangella halophila]
MARRTPALIRSLDILELFTDGRESVSAPGIVRELNLPRPSAHELPHTLSDRGYPRPHPDVPGRYQPGLQLFRLGSAYTEQLDLAKLGQQVAQDLVARCSETSHVAILDGTHVVYIAKVDSSQAVRMVSTLGGRILAHCTVLGKALLSALTESELRERFGHGPNHVPGPRSPRREWPRGGAPGPVCTQGRGRARTGCRRAGPVRTGGRPASRRSGSGSTR